jgi:Immunoglobulin-like domain of bacterial spore germination/Sporulation and spore germination
MKRLPIMIICVGLLATACGMDNAGSLGRAPAGTTRSSNPGPAGVTRPPGTSSAPGARPTMAPQSPSGQQQTPAPPVQALPREIGLQVWFTRQGKLFVTERAVPATVSVGRAAVDRLLAGPSAAEYAAGLRSQIPAGTKLRGLRISSGIATVDLSSSFGSGASPSTMPLRLAQVVYTLTQFPAVSGVRFEIDGQGVTLIGGVPVQSPQTRAMDSGYLPAITVRSPVIGQEVTSPVAVSGTADVFEATVSVRVLDSAGHEIARTFTTATCGTGCRGDYSVPVSYSVPRTEQGTIEVYESSAKDGRPVNVQRIPVTLS